MATAYYITGDCHGDFDKLFYFLKNQKLKQEDVVILLGDVALNYHMNWRDKENKELLSEFPNDFLCIHGNHEARPYGIDGYEERNWREGTVFMIMKDSSTYHITLGDGLIIFHY